MTAKPHWRPLPADDYSINGDDQARFTAEHVRGMLPASDPSLSQPVPAVDPDHITADHIGDIIARLQEVASGQRRGGTRGRAKRTLVGLAAPQIGERCRIIMIDTRVSENRRQYGKLECFINPEIVWQSRETAEGREGCFSAGPVWGLVRRPVAIKIRALDKTGQPFERILEGFTARIACHEIDHLNGVRFPERIVSEAKRHWVHSQELLDYPDHIQHWHRRCSLERWEAYKRGKLL
jgi:peptide deformylase